MTQRNECDLPTVAAVDRPKTLYADAGELSIAYCRSGSGSIDVVVMPGFASHVELMWEPPFSGRMFDRFARFARVTQIDKRGVGLSDRLSEPATLEQRMDDLRAVMDAEGIERAAIVGISDGATMSALFAATYPERVSSLVLWSGGAGPPAGRACCLARREPTDPCRSSNHRARLDGMALRSGHLHPTRRVHESAGRRAGGP